MEFKLVLLFCAFYSQAYCLDYFVYGPKTIRSFSKYSVSVLVQKAKSDVQLTCSLKSDVGDWSQNARISSDVLKSFTFEIGDLKDTKTVTFEIKSPSLSDQLNLEPIQGQLEITVVQDETSKTSVFIQTDKPLYKGGDLVKFRVLTVDGNLLPKSTALQVRIMDGAGNIVKQYLNASDPVAKGYFSAEYLLTKEPMLGKWSVVALIPSESIRETKEFRVDEYILPRFDVKLTPPNHVYTFDQQVLVTLDANYTFGAPVRGNATLTATIPAATNGGNRTLEATDFNGRYIFLIPTSFFNTWASESSMNVTVNFTETLTGAYRTVSIIIPIEKYDYKLTAITSTSKAFEPGFPFIVRFQVTDLDGRPLRPSTKQLTLSMLKFYHKRASWGDEVKINDTTAKDLVSAPSSAGLVEFNLTTPKESRRIEFRITYGDLSTSFAYKGLESPSNSFLTIEQDNPQAQIGESVQLSVKTTSHEEEPFQVLITSKLSGNIISIFLVKKSGKNVHIEIPTTSGFDEGANVLINYRRSDGELVGGYFSLSLVLQAKNSVTVLAEAKAGRDYTQPGENATVLVKTSPHAFVGLLAMDEGLLMMGTGNDITKSDINSKNAQQPDLSDSFSITDFVREAQMFLLTNARLPDSSEPVPYHPIWLHDVGFGGALNNAFDFPEFNLKGHGMSFAAVPEAAFMAGPAAMAGSAAEEKESQPIETATAAELPDKVATVEPTRIRKDFRESFLFEAGFSDEQGQLIMRELVPDTVTTWHITAFSLSNQTGLAVTSEASKVFQPFFVVLNLPFSVIRGEVLEVDVIIFNYFSDDQKVEVSLETPWQNFSKSAPCRAGEGTTMTFTVTPQTIGEMIFQVTARSAQAADRIERTLPVRPEGVKQYFDRQVFLDLQNVRSLITTIALPSYPPGWVPGSDHVEVRVVGDILGAAINNMDALIRLPTGCGEQTLAMLAPNVIVAKYLQTTGQLTSALRDKLVGNIQSGYQRELTYKHDDGSYSAWGKSDPSGSTWLTANAARVFTQASQFIAIDQEIVKKALNWLTSNQQPDGSFIEVGRIVDKQYQGGAAAGISLTAFTVLPFLESSSRQLFQHQADQAIQHLELNALEAKADNYTLAITAYALSLAKSPKAAELIQELDRRANKTTGNHMFWTSDSNADSKNVETTSYALLAFLTNSKTESAFAIISWLLGQQNSNGGFYSTPDTVVGITALANFAAATTANHPNLDISVGAEVSNQTAIKVDSSNGLVLQTVELPLKPQEVVISAHGVGTALATVSWTYHVRKLVEDAFDIVLTKSSSKEELKLEICLRYLKGNKSNMAVVEVEALSGYQFDEEEVLKLTKTIKGLRKVEVQDKGTHLNIYFDELTGDARCFKVTQYRLQKVDELKERSVTVYDYYNPAERKTLLYSL